MTAKPTLTGSLAPALLGAVAHIPSAGWRSNLEQMRGGWASARR
ncbi:MAG: hypothetical protein U1F25_03280 [Rubrivivax sp.]